MSSKKIVIVGGGLSGLVTAFLLAKQGITVTLIEKKVYPFHRVCGEYISNETAPFLKRLGLFPTFLNPPVISKFQLSSVNGKTASFPLDCGGFGVSRYSFDDFLFHQAESAGANFILGNQIDKIFAQGDGFIVEGQQLKLEADVVIGSFGKRSVLDVHLSRSFIKKRSPYLAVKYHVRSDQPADLISLHNFKGGYCGISRIENGRSNLCYLTHRDNLRRFGTIKAMEENVLFRNPQLKRVFTESDFLFEKPETINEISFETKSPVEEHILMTGDAAGMITPLCGNGMAMAIYSASLLAPLVANFCVTPSYSRQQLENEYAALWNNIFRTRLWAGRQIQRFFGDDWSSNMAVALAARVTPVAQWLVSKTHGKDF